MQLNVIFNIRLVSVNY